jgi:thiol:disulfide interchange protein DsbC
VSGPFFEPVMIIIARALRLLLAGSLAFACAAAWSDDAAIRRNWNLHNPKGPPIDEITKTPVAGLFELRVGGDLVYSDDQGNYLIYPSRDVGDGRLPDGHLIDMRTKTDVTDQRLSKLLEKEVPRLPYGDALVFKQGSGARRMVVFEDPNCHFCKDAEHNCIQLKDVTIYTFLIPILGPDSVAKARTIWCSRNNAQAWRSWMLEGVMPPRPMGKCDLSALDRNLDLAARHHLNYTPAIIFDDGSRFAGNADLEHLAKRLDEVAAAAKKG